MNQLTLEQPTAVVEAIEAGIASGALPEFWLGWQRDERTKKASLERLVQEGMCVYAVKYGHEADTVLCCPENVERLSSLPGIRVLTGRNVWHPNMFLIGRSGS